MTTMDAKGRANAYLAPDAPPAARSRARDPRFLGWLHRRRMTRVIPPSTPIPDAPEDAEADSEGSDDGRATVAPPFDLQAFARESPVAEAGPEDTDDDRPTVLPPFDAEAFARDSELKLRASTPPKGETTTDEARRLL